MHGQGGDKYENARLGMTGRLDALQAILIPKLEIFPDELKARQQVASTYEKLISFFLAKFKNSDSSKWLL